MDKIVGMNVLESYQIIEDLKSGKYVSSRERKGYTDNIN